MRYQVKPTPLPGTVHHAIAAHSAGIPWVTVISGIGSIATAGAFVIAFIVLGMQVQSQRRAQQDRHREHASRIAFWITLDSANPDHDPVYDPDAPCINMTIHVRNTSDRPAMAVLALAGVRLDVWNDAGAADGTNLKELVQERKWVAIGPGDTPDIPICLEVPASIARIVQDYRDDALIGELQFTDAAGIDWVKTQDGRLIEGRSAEWTQSVHLSLAQRDEERRVRAIRADRKIRMPRVRRLCPRTPRGTDGTADAT